MSVIFSDDYRVACPLFQVKSPKLPSAVCDLKICMVSAETAAKLNRSWHSRLPEIANFGMCKPCFAAEYDGLYYAIAMWSAPLSPTFNGMNYLELRRYAIAPDAPKHTASHMLSVMRKEIKRKMPTIVRFISYQDTEVRSGTIYKASGWRNVGRTHLGGKCGWSNNSRVRLESNGKQPLESVKHRWEYDL
jgi:hypothetical protein